MASTIEERDQRELNLNCVKRDIAPSFANETDRFTSALELAKDDVAVILVRFDKDSSRHIFNKISCYAKATQQGQNLITDDDDQIAMITRQMVGREGVLPTRLPLRRLSPLN